MFAIITQFTLIIYPEYHRLDYCGIFCGNNNSYNQDIPVLK